FIEAESRVIGARLLIAQGLSDLAIESLADPPRRFPFSAERSEFLATLSLATACNGDTSRALALAEEASSSATTVQFQPLAACSKAICAINSDATDAPQQTSAAFNTVLATGGIDSFVTAYRGYPQLLVTLAKDENVRHVLGEITTRAKDWKLAVHSNLAET